MLKHKKEHPLAIKVSNVFPIYDGKEPIMVYRRKVEAYENNIKKERYDYVFNYINIWLKPYNKKIRSFRDFKNMSEDVILADSKHNKKTVKGHMHLIEYFGLDDDNEEDAEIDTDE